MTSSSDAFEIFSFDDLKPKEEQTSRSNTAVPQGIRSIAQGSNNVNFLKGQQLLTKVVQGSKEAPMIKQNLNQALVFFDLAMEEEPNYVPIYHCLAFISYMFEKYDKAHYFLSVALNTDPINRDTQKLLKKVELKQKLAPLLKTTATHTPSSQKKKQRQSPEATVKIFQELKTQYQSPKMLYDAIYQQFEVKLDKPSTTLLFHVFTTGTTDGNTPVSANNWGSVILNLNKIKAGIYRKPQELVNKLKRTSK